MRFKIILFLQLLTVFSYQNLSASIDRCNSEQQLKINQTLGFLNQRSFPSLIKRELLKARKYYNKYSYQIKANNAGREQKVDFFYYESTVGENIEKPTILLFSGVQGISILERYIASKLTKKGFSVVISSLKKIEELDHIKKVKPFLLFSVFSSLNVLDFVSKIRGVDSNNISTIGVSLGGFRALYLSLLDLRIKSNVLVVSGLSISKAIAYSSLEIAKELRRKQMKGLNLEEHEQDKYFQALKKEIPFKAKDFICRRKTEDYFLFQSKKDTAVPYPQQIELLNSLGSPKVKTSLSFGHKGTVVLYALLGLKPSLIFIKESLTNLWEGSTLAIS